MQFNTKICFPQSNCKFRISKQIHMHDFDKLYLIGMQKVNG